MLNKYWQVYYHPEQKLYKRKTSLNEIPHESLRKFREYLGSRFDFMYVNPSGIHICLLGNSYGVIFWKKDLDKISELGLIFREMLVVNSFLFLTFEPINQQSQGSVNE